jgi:hypothetical protein
MCGGAASTSSYVALRGAGSEAMPGSIAKRVGKRTPLLRHPAQAVTFDMVNLDQLEIDPDAPRCGWSWWS